MVKTLGREDAETDRFAVRARELRDGLVAVGRVRGLFDPLMEALPSLGTLAVLLIGARRVADGGTDAGDLVSIAYLFTLLALPVRAIGWVLADLPRALAGFDRVTPVLDATGETHYGTERRAGGIGADLSGRGVDFAFEGADRPMLSGVTFDVAGRHHCRRRRAHRARASPRWRACWSGWSTPPTARSCSTASTCAGCARASSATRPRSSPRAPSSSTTRCAATSPSAGTSPTTRSGRRCAWPPPTSSSRRCPPGLDTRVGERGACLSGGQRQRLALARAVVRRPRLLVLDDATSAVDPSVEARILDALRAASERRPPPSSSSPTGRPPSAWPTRSSGSSTAGSSRAAATTSCSPRCPGYAALVRAYSAGGGGRVTESELRPSAGPRARWPPCAGACG